MMRVILATTALIALCVAAPALAADYPELRPAYPQGWQEPDNEDDIQFELGTAYWYSWGAQNVTANANGASLFSERDNTSIADVHGRIDDLYTNTYLLARAGIGLNTSGDYSVLGFKGTIGQQSLVGYSGVDYGWLPLGQVKNGLAFGGLIGYHYWKEDVDLPAVSTSLDIHALRLGLRATGDFSTFDIQSEVAAVPYAYVTGPGSTSDRAYGVMTETMIGFRPTDNISLRVGGRAWYLQNTTNGIVTADVLRYGLMAEVAGRF